MTKPLETSLSPHILLPGLAWAAALDMINLKRIACQEEDIVHPTQVRIVNLIDGDGGVYK